MEKKKRATFSSQIGFIVAAAGSAVGLGNIWRFPYLAAEDGGGLFIICYLVLTVTFGFTLLTTEIAIGRKTRQSSLTAYKLVHPKWGGIGILSCLVPIIILPYYCAIGGWVFKYLSIFITGNWSNAVEDNYFTDYITSSPEPFIWMLIFFGITAIIVFGGVETGIEKCSRVLMPILVVMIIGISFFALTLEHTSSDGIVRTGLDGLKVYLIPDLENITLRSFFITVMDAMGQLFFSISVAMGIMVTFGSYVKTETKLMTSINQIEIFDTAIALLAGMLIVPTVYVFMGKEGMSAGPGLIFVSLPKIFAAMGSIGKILGPIFFLIVAFAAITSSVSVMEAIVSGMMDAFGFSRKKSSALVILYTFLAGMIVCMGYNYLYFSVKLPNGTQGQILDVMDYLSNNILMPLVAFLTSILIGWIVKPDYVIDEVTQGKHSFRRKWLYIIMIRFVAPFLLLLLLLQSLGIMKL